MRAKVWKGRTASPLFSIRKYAHSMEKLFKEMWRKYENGEEVDHITHT